MRVYDFLFVVVILGVATWIGYEVFTQESEDIKTIDSWCKGYNGTYFVFDYPNIDCAQWNAGNYTFESGLPTIKGRSK